MTGSPGRWRWLAVALAVAAFVAFLAVHRGLGVGLILVAGWVAAVPSFVADREHREAAARGDAPHHDPPG